MNDPRGRRPEARRSSSGIQNWHLRNDVSRLRQQVGELHFRNHQLEADATQFKRRILELESMLDRDVASLLSLSEEVLVVVATFLTAEDLTNLGRTGKEYGWKRRGNQTSLANTMARMVLKDHATTDEQHVLPLNTGESEIARIRQLYLLRGPLEFILVGNHFGYSGDSKSAIVVHEDAVNLALVNRVMRKGRHWVTFSFANFYPSIPFSGVLGVTRPLPGWEKKKIWGFNPSCIDRYDTGLRYQLRVAETARWNGRIHACGYSESLEGECMCADWTLFNSTVEFETWSGTGFVARDEDDSSPLVIKLLLDLDAGTLTVHRNGIDLGVMMAGLSGEYCWFATNSEVGEEVTIVDAGIAYV